MTAAARAAGISHSTIGRWESDKFQPCLPELNALLRVYGATAEQCRRAVGLIQAPRATKAISEQWPDLTLGTGFRGSLLRAIRMRNGLSQDSFAEQLGLWQGAVSHWEHGRAVPEPHILERIIEVLQPQEREKKVLLGTTSCEFQPIGMEEIEQRRDMMMVRELRGIEDYADLDMLEIIYLISVSTRQDLYSKSVLVKTLGNYAFRLYKHGRFAEANHYAHRGVKLAWQIYKEEPKQYCGGVDCIFIYNRTRCHFGASATSCIELVQQWQKAGKQPRLQNALYSEQALWQSRLGRLDLAADSCRAAYEVAQHCESLEVINQTRRIWSEVLTAQGKPDEALKVYDESFLSTYPIRRAAGHLTRARTFSFLKEETQAQKELSTAQQLISVFGPTQNQRQKLDWLL